MYPAIVCKDAEMIAKFYEDNFGFKVAHKLSSLTGEKEEDAIWVMENEAGIRFDIINMDLPFSISIRVNVDDFDEALKFYKAEGFVENCAPVCGKSSKRVLLSKFDQTPILLIQHIKG